MPPIIDPMQNEAKDTTSQAANPTTPEHLNLNPNNSTTDLGVSINAEIEGIEVQTLELPKYLIGTIPPKKVAKFTDPFKYDPNKGEETEVPPAAEATQEEEQPPFKYLLGD